MVLLRDVIIGILIFGVIISASALFIGDITSSYGVNASTEFSETYSKINETHAMTESMEEEVKTEGGILATAGGFLWKGIAYVLQMVLSTLSTIRTMVSEMLIAFGLPVWFGYFIMGVIIITVVMLILSAFLRRDV